MSNIRKTFNFRDGVQVDDEALVVKGDRVGVGTTSPDESLDVRGNAKVIGIITANNLEISGVSTFTQVSIGSTITFDSTSGVITASSYKGDGSTLSNLPTSQWQNVNVVGAGASPIYVEGNVGIGTTNPENGLQIGGNPSNGIGVGFNTTGGVVASGVITATTFSGNLAGNVTGDLTGTASNATQAASATVATNAQGLTGTPDITVRNINSAGIGTIATLNVTDFTTATLKGHSTIRSIHGTTTTFIVTVASKTSAHRYNGSGSSNGYKIDGVEAPFITLTPGRTYRFDQSDGTNALHPLRFYYDVDKTTAYTTGVTVAGTQGSAGAYTEIVVTDTTPIVLHYQCSNHAKMGNSVQTNSNVLDTEHNSTVRGTMTATSFAGPLTGNVTGNVTGNLTGTAVTATTFTGSLVGGVTGSVTGSVTGNLVGIVTSSVSSIGVATATSLGVGTATANANIQIHDSSGASSIVIGKNPAVADNNLQIRYGGGASSFSGSEALDIINHGDGNFNYFITGISSFVWHRGNSNPLMALSSTGSLGIGITQPQHKLSVAGTSKITGVATFTNAVFIDGVLTVQDATISNLTGNVTGNIKSVGISTIQDLESTSIGIGLTASGNKFTVNSNVAERFFINTGGKVGIMTSILTPNIELDVNGDARFAHGLVVGVTTGLCAVDFSNCVDIFADNASRAALSYMLPPKVTNAQRNSLTSRTGGAVPSGAIIYNTNTNKLQVWNGSSWNDCF
tara:strand:- start:160 stop:2370 length:2211 start_codon:yes stop_codon:yes gene_type:complete